MQEIASVFAKTGTITQAQRSVACHWKARDYYKLFEIVPSKSEWTTCAQWPQSDRSEPLLHSVGPIVHVQSCWEHATG